MRLERLDLKPERSYFRPERSDLRLERSDLRPEEPNEWGGVRFEIKIYLGYDMQP